MAVPGFVVALAAAVKVEGEGMMEIGKQVRALSDADKEWFKARMRVEGIAFAE